MAVDMHAQNTQTAVNSNHHTDTDITVFEVLHGWSCTWQI